MPRSPGGAWTSTDAWVLAGLPKDRQGVRLYRLIGNMDAINHAIPTADELSTGLGALIAAGIVETDGRRFKQSASGASMTRHWTGGIFEWDEDLLPHLRKLPRPDERLPVTEAQVRRAYLRYNSSVMCVLPMLAWFALTDRKTRVDGSAS